MSDEAAGLDVLEYSLGEVMSEKYLAYALSTIVSRSLPDVRDGLKPVHRRILFAMRELKLSASTSPKKSARVVGDVIGKYHPHGDQSVYDALVRLAQHFAQRYPLVDGQGNFGSQDGDGAAQMRYTEARMTTVAEALLEGINENAVDFRETYDGETLEPVVLPANFPNLLANGAAGIAVGMATSIPPHNVGEICAALLHLIENKDCSVRDLIAFIKGPDFPTGGVLVEDAETIINTYETGRGGLRVRAKWEIEKLPQGKWQIAVTELPYQTQTDKLVEKLAEIIHAKKIPLLDDIRNESTDCVRLILIPKNRNTDADMLMEALFKYSALETRFPLNMNVLDGGIKPKVMNLKEVLNAFIDHRHEVLIRRSEFRLGKVNHRLEVLEGFLVAFLNIDEVIKIIRFEDKPKIVLMTRFELTEVQVESILNMRLRALRKLEEIEIKREYDELLKEREDLESLLESKPRRMTKLRKEFKAMDKAFGSDIPLGKRRTLIANAPKAIEVSLEAMVEKEPVTILCSEKGWIRALKGHVKDVSDTNYKEGDNEGFVLYGDTHDKLLIATADGKFYTLAADKLPSGRGFGKPLQLMFKMNSETEIISLIIHNPESELLVASKEGRGFIVKEKSLIAQTKNGKQVLNLPKDDVMLACPIIKGDHVAVIGNNRKLLTFPINELPTMGRGKGVILQRYKKDALLGNPGLSDITTFNLEEGLSWSQGEKTRTQTDLTAWQGKRAQAGRLPPHGFPKSNRFS